MAKIFIDMEEDEIKLHLETVEQAVESLGKSASLVALLLEIQDRLGFLSREALIHLGKLTGTSETTIYSVATFYNRFRFNPPGKRHIQVCMGTACHVRRGDTILDAWKRRLGIEVGQTTEDREYSIERVACVGCCSMAPVSVINGEIKPKMTTSVVDGILLEHEIKRDREKRESEKNPPEGGE